MACIEEFSLKNEKEEKKRLEIADQRRILYFIFGQGG
jgi:hypothetical protein